MESMLSGGNCFINPAQIAALIIHTTPQTIYRNGVEREVVSPTVTIVLAGREKPLTLYGPDAQALIAWARSTSQQEGAHDANPRHSPL